MLAIILSALAVISTILGGLTAYKQRDRLHRLLGFTAGVIIGVVAFDLLPEIFNNLQDYGNHMTAAMLALAGGFLLFHVVEKTILIHHAQEGHYESHHHPTLGLANGLALVGHSLLDGVGIGLAFQVSNGVGIAVAVAVIAHKFSDGLSTVSLMTVHRNRSSQVKLMLGLNAIAPLVGAASTLAFTASPTALILYLGFFTGFLLYIGASEILPEAHSRHSAYSTVLFTIAGTAVMFAISQLAA